MIVNTEVVKGKAELKMYLGNSLFWFVVYFKIKFNISGYKWNTNIY